jgi:phosphoribosylanthranilate isomerase
MTWIKICGITNKEDALTAVEAGADALGFVFYEKSPRYVDPEVAREIIELMPAHVERVGVFVNTAARKEVYIFNQARLTAFQAYPFSKLGAEDEKVAFGRGCFWQPPKTFVSYPMGFFLEDESRMRSLAADLVGSFEQIKEIPLRRAMLEASSFETVFLDSGDMNHPGGTGKPFEWTRAVPLMDSIRGRFKAVVAGGLNPGNVAECIHVLRPWGVDVSSGVEASPGKKDPGKVRAFVEAVRSADQVH